MSWRLFKAASCAAVGLTILFSSGAEAADPMGAVVAVQGRPTAAGPGGSRPLSAGSDLFEGDTIVVGDGNAQLQLDDGTKIVVGPSSRLILQAYLRRNATTASKVGIKALRGTFRFITGKSPKAAYNIRTSNATIGIRGTGFDFSVKNRTLLAVLEGAVKLRGNNGRAVNIGAGCMVGQAGNSNTEARELSGQAKADALNNELPYTTNQDGLRASFQLPISACLVSLGSNETPTLPGVTPEQLLLVAPLAGIPVLGIILLDNKSDKSDPISPETVPDYPPSCDTTPLPPGCD